MQQCCAYDLNKPIYIDIYIYIWLFEKVLNTICAFDRCNKLGEITDFDEVLQ